MDDKQASTKNQELPVFQANPEAAIARKTGRGRVRAAVLILVHLVILLHITHYLLAGKSLSPVEPSESMYALELGHLNAGTIFFGLAIVSTAIFGRFFCGWACHIVALQDLCAHVLRSCGLRPKPLRSRLLIIVPFVVAFYMFFWPTVSRLIQGRPHPGFTNHLLTDAFWKTFPGPGVSALTFVVCGGLIVYLLGNKGFCTYGCPYGAFFSIADRLAFGRIRVTDACHQCGQCTAACTSNVSVHTEVRDYGMVIDPGCMKCTDCVSVCPNDALFFGFVDQRTKVNLDTIGSRKRTYDFSIMEELFGLAVAAAVVFALRGLYGVTPFLLSVALGVISAYLAIQLLRLFRVRDLRIQNLRLKRNKQITRVGVLTVVLLTFWFAFNAHSFAVQYYRYKGRHHLDQVKLSLNDMFYSQSLEKLSDSEIADIDNAIRCLRVTDEIGLFDVLDVKLGLAIGNFVKGNQADAEKYFREAYLCDPAEARKYLVEFLASQGRQAEAKQLFE